MDDVWSVGVKPVYELTTSTGYSIRATAEHPFLVEGHWRELAEIAPGDLVGVAARTATHGGSTVSTAEIEMAALLISEGYTPDVRREHKTKPARIEGYATGEWVLLDYGDFIVHVFEEKARRFYDLERLWRDASRVALPAELSASAAPATTPAGGSLRSEE